MSMKLMAWLGDIEDEIGHNEFRVLFRLCWHCSERDLLCCPSIEELMRGAGMSKSTVLRALKELENRSFIQVHRERWDNGTQKNNRYTILADVVITLPNGRKVDLSPTAEQRANRVSPETLGENSRVSNQPGVTPDIDRVSIVTPNEQGRDNKEDSPLFLTEEPPPRDLLGDILVERPATADLIEYVTVEWAKLCEEYPRIQNPRVLNDARKKKIRARANEVARPSAGRLTPHDVWDQVFAAIRASAFLRGEAEPGRNYRDPFSLSIDKICEPARFLQTLERYSIDVERNQHTHSADGRRYGPAEQAMREVIASMGLDRE